MQPSGGALIEVRGLRTVLGGKRMGWPPYPTPAADADEAQVGSGPERHG